MKKSAQDHAYSYRASISSTFSGVGEFYATRPIDYVGCSLKRQSIILASKTCRLSIGEADGKRFNTTFHNYRFCIAMMGGLSIGMMMVLRYNIAVAILNMVNQTHLYLEENPNKTMDDFLAEGYEAGGDFNWDNEIQHMIMSWYMFAYTLPQVFTTKLGGYIGSRLMTPISLSLCAISSLLVPAFSYWGWEWVILLRLINGIGASAIIPMVLNLVEQWMPSDQISLGLMYSGLLSATVNAGQSLVSGYLCSIHWSWAFYIPGIITLIFCLLWLVIVTDKPEDSWLVSQRELEMICCCSNLDHDHRQEKKEAQESGASNQRAPQSPVPWTRVLRIPSFYCFTIGWSLFCVSANVFLFILPTYLRQFFEIPIAQNGFYCFIIQLGMLLAVVWPHFFLKFLQDRLSLSDTSSRHIAHVLVCSVVGLTWIYVGLFNEYQLPLLFLNRAFHSANEIVVIGTLLSNYAHAGLSSLVFSIISSFGNLTTVLGSPLVGWVLDYFGQSAEGWAWVYGGLGVSQFIYALIFVVSIRAGPIDL